MTITPETIVSDTELAALAGVSARRIRQLAEKGTLERVERGRYALGPSIRAMLDDAASVGSELQKERTRLVRAQADRAEMEFMEAKKLLAPVEEMQRVQAHVAGMIRTRMLNVAQRVVVQIVGSTDETEIKAILRQEIIEALTGAYDDVRNLKAEDISNAEI